MSPIGPLNRTILPVQENLQTPQRERAAALLVARDVLGPARNVAKLMVLTNFIITGRPPGLLDHPDTDDWLGRSIDNESVPDEGTDA